VQSAHSASHQRVASLFARSFRSGKNVKNTGKQHRSISTSTHNTAFKKDRLWLFTSIAAVPFAFAILYGDEVKMQEKDKKFQKHDKERIQASNTRTGDGDPPIYRIVLTGGPCGGKSTALAHISDRLQSLGFRVYRVPEAATMLITGGLSPWLMPEAERISFEGNLVKTKIALEDAFFAVAKASKVPSIIICDRGTMDTSAYLDRDTWEVVMDEFSWNVVDLRDKRYDAVIHMVTAAIGAETFYTTENNAARTENLQQARDLDFKVLNAWVGHPHIRIVDNSTDFKGKIARVNEIVCQMIGLPRPVENQRKFVVTPVDSDLSKMPGVKMEGFEVEQTYLKSEESSIGYTYLRRRGQNGIYTYTLSTVRSATDFDSRSDQQIILERAISGREYVALLKQADPSRMAVKKKVFCFLHENTYFELHQFLEPNVGLTILNTESDGPVVSFPWFIKVRGEVTGAKEFSSFYLAKHYNSVPSSLTSHWKSNSSMKDKYHEVKTKYVAGRKEESSTTSD
jgi:predicted ATPase/CYTH domain-containing protein